MSGTAYGKVVRDIGSGVGWLLSQARERWPAAKPIGADPADKGLEAARKVVPEAMLGLAPAGFLPCGWNPRPRRESHDMKHELQDLDVTLGCRSG